MLRREFVKLMGAIVFAPSLPISKKKVYPSGSQYGDFLTFTCSPVLDEDIRVVVNDVFLPQIKMLRKKLIHPWNKKNYTIIFKNIGSQGTIDPLSQRATIGWKYTDKEAA